MNNKYILRIFLCFLLVTTTGCIQFLPDGLLGGNDNSGDTSINASVEVSGGEVEIVDSGNANTIYLRGGGDDEQVLEEGDTASVEDGDLIVGEINGEEQLIQRVEIEQDNQNNNQDDNQNDSEELPTFGKPGDGQDERSPQTTDSSTYLNISPNMDWIVVSSEGNGHYSNIQTAIDSSPPYSTIVVREGIYNENVVINKEIDLIGLKGAILEGTGDEVGIQIEEKDITIDGLEIRGYEVGINTNKNYGEINLNNLNINNVERGVIVNNNYGYWKLENTRISNFQYNGISVDDDYGRFSIENVYFSNSSGIGLSVYSNRRSQNLKYLSFNNISEPVVLSGGNDINIQESWIPNDSLLGSCQSVTCDGKVTKDIYKNNKWLESDIQEVDTNEIHFVDTNIQSIIDRASEGDIIVLNGDTSSFSVGKDVKIIGNNNPSITGSEGENCITIENNASPIIQNVQLSGCSAGIESRGSGSWKLIDSVIEAEYQGILAIESTGNWEVWDSAIINSKVGVHASSSQGSWAVFDSTISGHENVGFMLSRYSGDGLVRYSKITQNNVDVRAISDSGVRAAMQRNWWGNEMTQTAGSIVNSNIKCNIAGCLDKKQLYYYDDFSGVHGE